MKKNNTKKYNYNMVKTKIIPLIIVLLLLLVLLYVINTNNFENYFIKLNNKYKNLENFEDINNSCASLPDLVKRQQKINEVCMSIYEGDKLKSYREQYETIKINLSELEKQDKQIKILKEKLNDILENNNSKEKTENSEFKNISKILTDLEDNKTNQFLNNVNLVLL